MNPSTKSKQPVIYQIKIIGSLDNSWSDWLGHMAMTIEQENGEIVTTMTGPVTDQAALRGILEKIWDLNLTLLSVSRPVDNSYASGFVDEGGR